MTASPSGNPLGLVLVQIPDCTIQIRSKGKPNKVGNLQICCQRIDLTKGENHPHHQDPQKEQPEKSKAKRLGVKEDQAPKKVNYKLCNVKIDTFTPLGGLCRQVDSCCAESHKCIQNAPYDREENGRRCQRRLYDCCTIYIHTVSC